MKTRTWQPIEGFNFKEILFEEFNHIAKITINRPRYRNAFTPLTVWEMSQALAHCNEAANIRVVILTGAGDKAFCSGGDMNVKGRGGYVGGDGVPRLNVLEVQMQIRRLPKPVIAMVNGYAIGGGHVLHLMCDLTIASTNAIFGQTGPRVGSFDAGFGASYLARIVGQKKAREIWFLCRQYSAEEAEQMGLVNRMPNLTDRPVYNNLPATQLCSTTRSTKPRKVAKLSWKNVSPISTNIPISFSSVSAPKQTLFTMGRRKSHV